MPKGVYSPYKYNKDVDPNPSGPEILDRIYMRERSEQSGARLGPAPKMTPTQLNWLKKMLQADQQRRRAAGIEK